MGFFVFIVSARRTPRVGDIQFYFFCEDLTQVLLFAAIVFSPWAFGTTEHWSEWTMNVVGYLLGLALLAKMAIRFLKGYRPPRWGEELSAGETNARGRHWTLLLAIQSFLLLAYCLTSAINARATYEGVMMLPKYSNCIMWLPHSMDASRSWYFFWRALAWACFFWALRDWLLGKSGGEERGGTQPILTLRLRRFLWVLAINGGLVALEGIIQRLEGSGRLLFMIKPLINPEAVSQFGPYHYRANASSFFNLLWPVTLGFWWLLRRAGMLTTIKEWALLASTGLMAAAPIISSSRAGAMISIGLLVLSSGFLLIMDYVRHRKEGKRTRGAAPRNLLLFFAGALVLGLSLGWNTLAQRMEQIGEGYEQREQMYQNARQMTEDYPLFGTGPGTYASVVWLYTELNEWGQLHNDWLETRITFGWLGSALVALVFFAAVLRWFAPGGIRGSSRFVTLVWLALAGCLLHARWDFPFQIYSILLLFLMLCAILSTLARRP